MLIGSANSALKAFVSRYKAHRGVPKPQAEHTLDARIAQTERLTGLAVERAYVDRGYRGHDVTKTRVYVSGHKHGIAATGRTRRSVTFRSLTDRAEWPASGAGAPTRVPVQVTGTTFSAL